MHVNSKCSPLHQAVLASIVTSGWVWTGWSFQPLLNIFQHKTQSLYYSCILLMHSWYQDTVSNIQIDSKKFTLKNSCPQIILAALKLQQDACVYTIKWVWL